MLGIGGRLAGNGCRDSRFETRSRWPKVSGLTLNESRVSSPESRIPRPMRLVRETRNQVHSHYCLRQRKAHDHDACQNVVFHVRLPVRLRSGDPVAMGERLGKRRLCRLGMRRTAPGRREWHERSR